MNKNHVLISAFTVMTLILSGCSGLTVGLNTATTTKIPESAQAGAPAQAVPTATLVPSNPAAQPASLEAMQESLRAVYDNVNPSVVNLRVVQKTTVAAVPSIPELPEIPGFPFNLPQDQPSQEFRQEGQGSGFIWDNQGNIVTNNHVIESADQVTVTFSDGTSVEGKVVGADPDSDLAVVKVNADASILKPVKLADSTQADVGQIVIAIGNPFGLEGTMTFGIISGLGRTLPVSSNDNAQGPSFTIPDIIQTDAPINPGNSGGVLVDIEGRVLGVTTAIESPVRASSGVGFIVPSATVQKVVPSLIKSGSFAHTWLGISGTTLTPELNKAAGIKIDQQGVLVYEVTSGSPADKAKLQGSDRQVEIDGQKVTVGGDIITAIDKQSVKEFDTLVEYLERSTVVGQKVSLTILHQGKEQTVEVTLAARPKSVTTTTQTNENTPAAGVWLGIQGLSLNTDINKAMGLSEDQTGVLVQQIEPNSPADKAGLHGSFKPFTLDGNRIMIGGDVITAIDGNNTPTIDDLKSELGQHKSGEEITLTIMREKSEIKVKVKIADRPAQ
jgi:serine protease Do